MTPLVVENTIWIDANRDRVWDALTCTDDLGRWWSPHRWEIPALEAGATVKFHDTGIATLYATIESVDAPRHFALRWQPNHWYPADTLVTAFQLDSEQGGARVTITHTGFEGLPAAVRQGRMDGAQTGYAYELRNLKAYLEDRS
jgi:uncharacterized protein YndB with AHSA1/START domain